MYDRTPHPNKSDRIPHTNKRDSEARRVKRRAHPLLQPHFIAVATKS
jgi:hypothetical protein